MIGDLVDDPIRKVKVNTTFTYKLVDQIKSKGNYHGTLVFKGLFNGTIPISLKRYQKFDENTIKYVQNDIYILGSLKIINPISFDIMGKPVMITSGVFT